MEIKCIIWQNIGSAFKVFNEVNKTPWGKLVFIVNIKLRWSMTKYLKKLFVTLYVDYGYSYETCG